MTMPHTSRPAHGYPARRFVGFMTLAALLGAALLAARSETPVSAADPPAGKPKETLVEGKPLFSTWPANQKPDAVIVFSGQTFGYLQPCGCSRPQTGGLERRAVLMQSLRAKGWPVAGVDLGDIYAEKVVLSEQGQMKYLAAMNALRDMGYIAVGIGQTELKSDPLGLLGKFAWQKEQRPFTLAGNLVGYDAMKKKIIPRTEIFTRGKDARPAVEIVETAKVGEVNVGVAGVIGKGLGLAARQGKWEPVLEFEDVPATLKAAVDALAKHNSQLKVLIYQGPSVDVVKPKGVAEDFPQFQLIICQSDTDLPPLRPQVVKHANGEQTLVVQVGHKGQHVGVVGAFKRANGGGFDFEYQLVPLTEEFITPGDEATALKTNPALQALEDYAKAVKAANLLPQYPRVSHPAQIVASGFKPPAAPVNLTYVGSDACQACHAAEFKVWKNHPHSHAMATLENVAKRPSLRQFDGECVICHTVGFDYKTGYVDDVKTKHLRDVGCENCHGPGSGHVAAPKNKDLLELLSPWKQPGVPKLPNAAFMKKMADTPPADRGKEVIAPAQQLLIRRVESTCMKCHDHEADPHFDLYKAWQKVDHTGLAPKEGWPAVAPKNPAPAPVVTPK
jgi:hypothetical protein